MENVNENLQVLDVQMRSGKESYIGILVGHISRMAYIIASDKLEPAKTYYMANLIIAMVPGQDRRKELIKKLKEKIDEVREEKIKDGYQIETAKDIAITAASIYIVGDATDFLNLHLGITKEARVEIDLFPDIAESLKKIEEQKEYIVKLEKEIKDLKGGNNALSNKN